MAFCGALRRRDLWLVEYWRVYFYIRFHKLMGANFRENLSHAPAPSGRNLFIKKLSNSAIRPVVLPAPQFAPFDPRF